MKKVRMYLSPAEQAAILRARKAPMVLAHPVEAIDGGWAVDLSSGQRLEVEGFGRFPEDVARMIAATWNGAIMRP